MHLKTKVYYFWNCKQNFKVGQRSMDTKRWTSGAPSGQARTLQFIRVVVSSSWAMFSVHAAIIYASSVLLFCPNRGMDRNPNQSRGLFSWDTCALTRYPFVSHLPHHLCGLRGMNAAASRPCSVCLSKTAQLHPKSEEAQCRCSLKLKW